ncbi:type-F conjugative transfer system pilin assembly protein TrbC [Photobacterium leiognathi]|uniref:type-F conjugative transfer system pilin assembly protein TrbC n=1 Tax=Photobacterium leiognathi TaxID=553611 RepID=UPI00273998F3|nr:type-F conjugative transfer system pilin assembly protein TrbC [Photobacterium leiognathi]
MNWLILLPGAFLSASVLAQPHWTAQAAQQTEQTKAAQGAAFLPTPEAIDAAFDKAKRYQAAVKAQEKTALNRLLPKGDIGTRSPVMILASLGMPKASLQALLHQASQYQVPVVIRGLYQNSFPKTVERVQSLIQPDNQAPILSGIEINPTVFKTFSVTHVPAFIVVKPNACESDAPCPSADFDVVYGNVSLPDALDLLRQGIHKDQLNTVIRSSP